LFESFVRFRGPMTTGLGADGEVALATHTPVPVDRALDIGCGFGDTTRRLAELVGDVQIADLDGPYDYVFSRMGLMFFANPVAALRNVRAAMRPGGRLCAVVWRRKLDTRPTTESARRRPPG
jgi:SAM-dependent methyltransferase